MPAIHMTLLLDGGPGVSAAGHYRLSVARKELLVECREMDGISSVAGSLAPVIPAGFVDPGNQANTHAQGYNLASTMQSISGFFGMSGAPVGNPPHFPGADFDTYWVRLKLNDMDLDVTYGNGAMKSRYKYSGTYMINSQSQGDGWLSIAYDNQLRSIDEDYAHELYRLGQGVSILANADNRHLMCSRFVKVALQGRKGTYDNLGNARISNSGFAIEVDGTGGDPETDYRFQGAAIFVNSISEESSALTWPDSLRWAVAHELGHLVINGRGMPPFNGAEHIETGLDNLMGQVAPSSFSSCKFHESEIIKTNFRQRASVDNASNNP